MVSNSLDDVSFYADDSECRVQKTIEPAKNKDNGKKNEVSNELKKSNTSGREIEVSLEAHRSEKYTRVTLAFRLFAGTGHVVDLSGSGLAPFQSSSASHTSKTVETPDAVVLEKLAESFLKTSPSSTSIRLRLPDISIPVRIQLDLNRTLIDVRKFLNGNVSSLQTNAFEFMGLPLTKIKREAEKRKICDRNIST
ncbi:unnamed protein product [Rotaria socialis]|uniref:Uncharacterized protein n=1 Tax=Rotaria socialis TaxID=392032 RepID=A0A820K7G5_9BILA|nr:unnamed protein product [Rotaria socialis]CAF4335418.1 unnamed protein product [Rotaria socialis]